MIHMGFVLWILFVCGWVVGVQVLYKCVWKAVLKRNNNMTEVARNRSYYSRMLGASSSSNSSSAERSRARRRRRIELRRNSEHQPNANNEQVLPEDGSSDSDERSVVEGSSVIGIPVPAPCFSWAPVSGGLVMRQSMPRLPLPALTRQMLVPATRRAQVPVVGAVALAGRQRQMEDAVAIKTNLCSPLINRARPVHYFAVYDGHGGPHHALICKQKMHAILKEELTGVQVGETSTEAIARPPGLITDEIVLKETWRILISRVFSRTETVGQHTCICGNVDFQCGCDSGDVSFSGTTAVAMVLTERHIIVGNCGDSRAVLYRRGRVVPLTFDHKPERDDEKARIEASGGRVVYIDTPRVQGILAMSRAIGDAYLKPYVISEPEVTFTKREEEDEFMILATDGMWDVISIEMAGGVARECLKEPPATPRGNRGRSRFPSRSASAASLLTRLALARRSVDNISVVVIDLTRNVDSPIPN